MISDVSMTFETRINQFGFMVVSAYSLALVHLFDETFRPN